jgi:hypothetical protein
MKIKIFTWEKKQPVKEQLKDKWQTWKTVFVAYITGIPNLFFKC